MKSKIAIFASGRGTNARQILSKFQEHPEIEVSAIICNRKTAGIYDVARSFGKEVIHFTNEEIRNVRPVLDYLSSQDIDWIVLAGFMQKIPPGICEAFPHRIINLHPALLPKFGGKGMYGDYVHAAVLKAGEIRSGISIHYVNEHYDEGDIIAQFDCEVKSGDHLDVLKERVAKLEHRHYPAVIENLILENKRK